MTMKHLFFRYLGLLLLLGLPVSSFAFSCQDVTEIPVAECDALITLYDSTDGDNWRFKTGWKQTYTPCSWQGIKCTNGHISSLNIQANLSNISILETDLPYLNELSIGSDLTEAPIPEINIPSLEKLYIFGEKTTSVPNFAYLSNLKSLQISDTSILKTIPTFSNLDSLEGITIAGNMQLES
ncbi:hypothetical protein, partial [Candidatus Albibeggiatoa sp. nov. BB20]|uniref:hypothetical protein n=1 Tax=Candidatus Albibeggiatoa sp. nov. BB20 TaxID=3162723 RepID=UPI00336581CB